MCAYPAGASAEAFVFRAKEKINQLWLKSAKTTSGDTSIMSRALKPNTEARIETAEVRGRPIDLVYLARQTLGDPGLEGEILTLFSEMSATYLDRVRQAASSEEAAIGLHALKGAAAGVGAGAIASEAAAAERDLQATGSVGEERLSDLAIAVEEARVFISDLLSH